MSLEEKIIAWSEERPEWQRDIMRRLAIGEILSDEDYDNIVNSILNENAGSMIPIDLEHFSGRRAQDPAVRILSVTKAEHVNALAADESLNL